MLVCRGVVDMVVTFTVKPRAQQRVFCQVLQGFGHRPSMWGDKDGSSNATALEDTRQLCN